MRNLIFLSLFFFLAFGLVGQEIEWKLLTDEHKSLFEKEEKVSLPKGFHTLLKTKNANVSIYSFPTERSVYTAWENKKFYRKIVASKNTEQITSLAFTDKIFYAQDTYTLSYKIDIIQNGDCFNYLVSWEKEQDGFSPENLEKFIKNVYEYAREIHADLKKAKQAANILQDLAIIGIPFESYKNTIGDFYCYPQRAIVDKVVYGYFEWTNTSGWPPKPHIVEMPYTILAYHSVRVSSFYNVIGAVLKASGTGSKVAILEVSSASWGGTASLHYIHGEATFSMQK